MAPASSTQHKQSSFSYTLLRRANSPGTATDVHNTKLKNKRLSLLPTVSKNPRSDSTAITSPDDARAQRQQRRAALDQSKRCKARHKPRPLSAKEKRKQCIYDIPKHETDYKLYKGLHGLWCGYMRDVLGIEGRGESEQTRRSVYVTPGSAGQVLATADYHGAEMEVVRSTCAGRVGTKGIMVRETMYTFNLVTRRNRVVCVPKEGTIFRFTVPVVDQSSQEEDSAETPKQEEEEQRKPLVFEIHGDEFKTRPASRASKKWRWHPPRLL